MTRMLKVQKYEHIEPTEFSIGNKTFPIIKDEDEVLIYHQVKNIQEWFTKNPGTRPSEYLNVYEKLRCTSIKPKGSDHSYRTREAKLLLEETLIRLPYDTEPAEEIITYATILPSNVLLRMIGYLVCCAILVDESKDTVQEECEAILNAVYRIMSAFENKKGHVSDIDYDKLEHLLQVIFICTFTKFNPIISRTEFADKTHVPYIKGILKQKMISKYHKLDIRSFRRLIECYYGGWYSNEETYLFIRKIYQNYPFLNDITSYMEYHDSVYPHTRLEESIY